MMLKYRAVEWRTLAGIVIVFLWCCAAFAVAGGWGVAIAGLSPALVGLLDRWVDNDR